MALVKTIFFILYFLTFLSVANSQTDCYNSENCTTDGTYAKNRDLLFSYIASNVTSSSGFYNTSAGQGNETVYGHVLCRPDISAARCSNCVNIGIQDIKMKCPNRKEAITWSYGDDSPCIIRYANYSSLGDVMVQPTQAGYNTADLTSNIEDFNQIWTNLMENVSTKASIGTSKLKAATDEAKLTEFQNIYTMMLCSPDISQRSCKYCLQQAVAYYRTWCFGKQGGYVNKPSCTFRWDLYSFYTPITEAPQPSPQPPPPPGSLAPPPLWTVKGKRYANSLDSTFLTIDYSTV